MSANFIILKNKDKILKIMPQIAKRIQTVHKKDTTNKLKQICF